MQEILELLDVPYTGSGVSACIRCMDKVLAKHAMRDAGIPTPDFYAFNETAFKELGRRRRAAGDRGAAGVPDRRQAGRAGVRAGDQVRPLGRRRPGGARGRLLLRHARSCSSATSRVATSRSRSWTSRTARPPCPWSRRSRSEEDFYDFEARYEIGRSEFVCPADIAEATAGEAQRLALDVYRLLGCVGLRAGRPDARSRGRVAHRPGDQRDPRADRDEPAAAGRRGGGAGLRRAGGAPGGAGALTARPTRSPRA